jgi:restriction system protein
MAAPIYPDSPESWQDLEARVAQVLRECGFEVEVGKSVTLARGDVNIDVWADDHSSPPNVIAIECRN